MNEVRIGCNRLFVLPFLLVAGSAVSAGINLKCTNDGIVDVYVTVYDMSTSPATMIISRQRLNGNTSIPISVNLDANGKASLSWTAISIDARDCGRGTSTGLDDGASLNVHVDSGCPGQ
jgi:hypothetical protein